MQSQCTLQTTPKILGLHAGIATITDQEPQQYKASSFMSLGCQYSGIKSKGKKKKKKKDREREKSKHGFS